jgi:hypothetical protein
MLDCSHRLLGARPDEGSNICAFATQATDRGMAQNSECPARSRPQKARDKADGRSGSHLAGPQRQQLHPADWGERESARGSRWLDRPSLAIKETGPEPWIFPIKQLFFSSSAGNKMTVSRV